MNENEDTITQNLCDSVKAMLRGRFIALQAYLKKQEKSQINNLLTTPKATREGRNEEPQGQQKERNLKNQGRNKCKRNYKDTIAKINIAKSWFFEKIKLTNHQQDSLRNKVKRTKLTKFETKMERSQQTTLKYKGS